MLTAEMVRERLSYDRKTGRLRWLVKPRPQTAIGAIAGAINRGGYVQIRVYGRMCYAHRLAWLLTHGKWPDGVIDHVNGNKADNRIENLRDIPMELSPHNVKQARKDNVSSGLLGVSVYGKAGKFRAAISVNSKRLHLGVFNDPRLAHEAYVNAKREYHEGAVL